MIVLSLFDGMSCGQLALSKLGIKVDKYFASEIDGGGIQVTQSNFQNTIQVGDITKLFFKNGILYSENGNFTIGNIDLVIGGSPCQSFSSHGDNTGFNGKSGLFWEYIRLLNEINPKWFLLENVRMKAEWRDTITKAMRVNPIEFNSNLVSAQNRDRLYWTNIPFELPEDRNILYKNILEDLPFRELKPFMFNKYGDKIRLHKGVNWILNKKSNCLTTKNCHPNQYLLNEEKSQMRLMTVHEYEKLQTIPIDYTFGVSNTKRFELIGNGWTVDVIAHIFGGLATSV